MDGESEKAQTAQAEEVTLFDKIAQKKIPATIVYEDDMVRYITTPFHRDMLWD